VVLELFRGAMGADRFHIKLEQHGHQFVEIARTA